MTRRFARTPVARERLTALLDLARRVPSAGFAQGTSFVVLDGDLVAEFWEVSGAGAWFAERQPGVLDAPVIVIPVADPSAYTGRYQAGDKAGHGLEQVDGWAVPFWLTDTAMAAQQLLLLLEDDGLGALLFGLFRHRDRLTTWLALPEGTIPLAAIAVGERHPDDRPSGSPTRRARRPADDVIHWGRWAGAPARDG
jgi:nitroreductase